MAITRPRGANKNWKRIECGTHSPADMLKLFKRTGCTYEYDYDIVLKGSSCIMHSRGTHVLSDFKLVDGVLFASSTVSGGGKVIPLEGIHVVTKISIKERLARCS